MNNLESKPKKLMKIGQLEQESGIGKSTIHYYINLGLLPPPIRRGLNLRIYDQAHLAALKKIKYLRNREKMSLKDIKEILDQSSVSADRESSVLNEKEPESVKNGSDSKKAQLIDTAVRLFSERGYESVRISDITDTLHMGKSTFYLYFGSKEEIFLECIEKLSVIVVPEDSWEDIIKEKDFFKKQALRVKAFLQAFSGFSGMIGLAKRYSTDKNQHIAKQAKDSFLVMTHALEKDILRAQREGYIKNIDADVVSHMMLGMAENLGYRLYMDSKYSVDDFLKIYEDFLRAALATKKKL